MYQPIQLSVNTDKDNYGSQDAVTVTITTRKNNQPAPNEVINLAVFRPTGKRTFRTVLHTDTNGIAVAVFSLDNKDVTGSYSVEARAADGSLALTSFLVI